MCHITVTTKAHLTLDTYINIINIISIIIRIIIIITTTACTKLVQWWSSASLQESLPKIQAACDGTGLAAGFKKVALKLIEHSVKHVVEHVETFMKTYASEADTHVFLVIETGKHADVKAVWDACRAEPMDTAKFATAVEAEAVHSLHTAMKTLLAFDKKILTVTEGVKNLHYKYGFLKDIDVNKWADAILVKTAGDSEKMIQALTVWRRDNDIGQATGGPCRPNSSS